MRRSWLDHDKPPAWFVLLVAIGQAVVVEIGQAVVVEILRRVSEGMGW